jgi:hypothetical protein
VISYITLLQQCVHNADCRQRRHMWTDCRIMMLSAAEIKWHKMNVVFKLLIGSNEKGSRSRWPRGIRRRSAAAWLLGSRDGIPLRALVFVSCVYMLCFPV